MYRLIALYFLALTCVVGPARAQKENVMRNDDLLKTYLQAKRFSIDTGAQAVILYEEGYTHLASETMEFHVERTVKLLSDQAVNDLGTVNIPFRDRTFVTKIEATTYNLENGEIKQQSIGKSDVIREKLNENTSISKFNLPGLKKGSIVHYAYSIYRPATLLIPEWNFQDDYPVLYSEYTINIPPNITYNSIERLNVPMIAAKRKRELYDCESCSYSESFGGSSEIIHKWVRRNIPAFKTEPYMSSPDNFRERVKVNIVTILNNGFKTQVFNNWEDFTRKYFYNDQDFGGQAFAPNAFLKEQTEELTRDKATDLDKAKAIFAYVRDGYTAESTDGSDNPEYNIKNVFTGKAGSPQGINLLLTAMLRKANLEGEPLLMSTRDHERLNALYIDPRSINYVVSKLTIDSVTYLLDASGRYNPFNTIPVECYNGYSRSINKAGGSPLILDPDSIRNKTTIIARLSPVADSSKLLLSLDKQYGVFSAMAARGRWAGDTAAVREEIAQGLGAKANAANISNISVKNLTEPDEPLVLHYELLTDFDRAGNVIYMDPFFEKMFDRNPLPQAKRKYTIEMNYLQDINYVFRFDLPEGYELDDYPKSTVLQYGEGQLAGLKSIMSYEEAPAKSFTLNSRFTTRTTRFAPEEYESLRSFYERVIEEQSKKLIIKKTVRRP